MEKEVKPIVIPTMSRGNLVTNGAFLKKVCNFAENYLNCNPDLIIDIPDLIIDILLFE